MSLVDRRTGREWLAPGRMPDTEALRTWSEEDATFGGEQAFGWDECLPTIARSPDPMDPHAPPLRDHGNYWGREAATSLDEGTIVTDWPPDRWGLRFLRRLRIDSSAVIADYALHNPTRTALPFLWSAHPLLQLEPGTQLHIPRADRVQVESSHGVAFRGRRAAWPRALDGHGQPVDLDLVPARSAGIAVKVFARGLEGRAGALTPDGSWIGLAWDTAFAPSLGLWLDHGAWPADEPLQQVALEPSTASHDALAAAIADRQVATVAPGRTVRWWMRIEVGTQPPGLAAFLRG